MSDEKTATVFINGKIFLSRAQPGTNPSPTQPPAFDDALLIKDSLITAVGSPSSSPAIANALASPTTTVIDLSGKTVLPGFVDGHMHLMLFGQSLSKLDLGHCKSLSDIKSSIRTYAVSNPDLPRIVCRGWMHSMTPGGVTATDLDDIDPLNRPILIDTKDLHFSWCNTAGLAALGAYAWLDVPGGTIQRDGKTNKPNGVFGEAANMTYVWPYLASVATTNDRKAFIRAAIRAYHASGYTGLIDMAMDDGAWAALLELRDELGPENMGMRIAAYWLVKPGRDEAENLTQVNRAAELAKLYNSRTSPDCRIVGIKVICDGIIDACTAGLTEPYSHNNETTYPLWTKAELEPVVRRADEAGLQIALHAIGDATISMVVDVLEKHASAARRPRIEHIELASKEDAGRLGKLGITASIQPVHADPAILRAWPRLLGEHRCARAFAYREFADGGAPLALGSDSPTAPHAPLANVYVGTTRRSYREPEMEGTVNEQFALGLCEAVVGATEGAAYSCFEDRTGRLAVGMKADFLIVDMQWEKTKLLEAKVKETWFDGKKVWSTED